MCRWRVRARLRGGYIIIVIITRLPDRPADTLRIFPAVFPPMLLQQGMIGRQPLTHCGLHHHLFCSTNG